MRSIVLVGVPWNPDELGEAACDAAALGYRLCVVGEAAALRKVPAGADCDRLAVPAVTCAAVTAAVSRKEPAAVLTLSEQRLELSARVQQALGLQGTAPEAARAVVDKPACREVLARAGLTSVRFAVARLDRLPETVRRMGLPVVVKPRRLAGSNGVRHIGDLSDIDDLLRLYDLPVAATHGNDQVLVESVIPGTEISAEALVVDGRLVLLGLTDKIGTGPPYFAECGHVLPSRYSGRAAQVGAYLQRVIDALGLVTAPIHAELKLTDSSMELVEINVRFGGGGIVRLMTNQLSFRPYAALFSALVEGRLPATDPRPSVWGVGFFTAPVSEALSWPSYDFPHPGAVVHIDLDTNRAPKLTQFEGIAIRYWRPGHVLFTSRHYEEVRRNAEFMLEQFCISTRDRAGCPAC